LKQLKNKFFNLQKPLKVGVQKEVIEELYRPGIIEKSNANYQKILKMKMKKNKINKIFMKN